MEMTDKMHDILNKTLKERGLPTIEEQGGHPIGSPLGLASLSAMPTKPLSEEIDEETHLRFGYIPFVIAEVAWDYVDSAIDMSCILRCQELKRLCRTLKDIRQDYLWWRKNFSGQAHFENEEENMLTFQDDLHQFFSNMYQSQMDKLRHKYPDVKHDYLMMIATAYSAIIIYDALFKYVRYMNGIVVKKVRHPIGNLLPKHLHQISRLMPEFAGDCPLKEEFEQTRSFFADTLVEHIKSIELFD